MMGTGSKKLKLKLPTMHTFIKYLCDANTKYIWIQQSLKNSAGHTKIENLLDK